MIADAKAAASKAAADKLAAEKAAADKAAADARAAAEAKAIADAKAAADKAAADKLAAEKAAADARAVADKAAADKLAEDAKAAAEKAAADKLAADAKAAAEKAAADKLAADNVFWTETNRKLVHYTKKERRDRKCSPEAKEGTCQIYEHPNYKGKCWMNFITGDAKPHGPVISSYKCGAGADFVFGTSDGKPALGGHEAESVPILADLDNRLTWFEIRANSGTKSPLTWAWKMPETAAEWLPCKKEPAKGTCQFY